MTNTRQQIAKWGESLAENYLLKKGYLLITKNARTPHGEIDLIVQQEKVIVFVEVKTRTSTTFGQPEEAVTPTKQAHLLASAQFFLQKHPDFDGDWRIDVIAIRQKKNASHEIIHFENAVGG